LAEDAQIAVRTEVPVVTLFLIIYVHTSQLRVADIVRAGICIGAIQNLPARLAAPASALLSVSADIVVVAWSRVVRVDTAFIRHAGVVGAAVPVITGHNDGPRPALLVRACVPHSARVLITAGPRVGLVGAAGFIATAVVGAIIFIVAALGFQSYTASPHTHIGDGTKRTVITTGTIAGGPACLMKRYNAGHARVICLRLAVVIAGAGDEAAIRSQRVGTPTSAIAQIMGALLAVGAGIGIADALPQHTMIGVGAGIPVIAGSPIFTRRNHDEIRRHNLEDRADISIKNRRICISGQITRR
jgi:hypothetical protein